jgi:hypothetical protein
MPNPHQHQSTVRYVAPAIAPAFASFSPTFFMGQPLQASPYLALPCDFVTHTHLLLFLEYRHFSSKTEIKRVQDY